MTAWKLTVRTSPGSLIAAEYECPVHGRFALDVPRGEDGDPPREVVCERALSLREAFHHPTKGLRWASPGAPCREPSSHVISAPGIARVKKVTALVRGSDNVKPEFSTWTDTTNLAEGQDLDDWKADRAKVWERENERQAMELAREL